MAFVAVHVGAGNMNNCGVSNMTVFSYPEKNNR